MSKWVTTCLQCWTACATCAMAVPVKGLGHRQRVFHQCICPHQWAPLQRKKKERERERERESRDRADSRCPLAGQRRTQRDFACLFAFAHSQSVAQTGKQAVLNGWLQANQKGRYSVCKREAQKAGWGRRLPFLCPRRGIGDIAVRTKADASERKSTEKCAIFTDRCTICAAYYYRHHFWLVKIETDWSGQSIERQISLHQC